MTHRKIVGLLVSLISAGWLLPLGLGIESYLDFWQSEAWPLLAGTEHHLNSFPYLHFASQCLWVSILWLSVVIVAWSYALFISLGRSRAA